MFKYHLLRMGKYNMGLSVTAFNKLQKMDNVFHIYGNFIDSQTKEIVDNVVRFTVNPHFPSQALGIENGGIYHYEKAYTFHVGSYGTYNWWRDELAKMVGHINNDTVIGGPFYELIEFSDCCGSIGPAACAKLAKDFANYQEKADQHEDELFHERYENWRIAFELAADNGAVDFH